MCSRSPYRQKYTDLEVQIEAPTFNTTLAPNFACPNAGKLGSEPGSQWARDWVDKYLADKAQSLSSAATGLTIVSWSLLSCLICSSSCVHSAQTPRLLFAMQQLCSYDTVAFGHSDFCALFTREEWLGYECERQASFSL